jgi:hypothetical protein
LQYGRHDNDHDVLDYNVLKQRLEKLRVDILEQELRSPPNAHLSPTEFVEACLLCLSQNADPRPDAGFRTFLRASTPRWRNEILKSIGAPPDADLDVSASALGDALSRPHNQYRLLVVVDDDIPNQNDAYRPVFPSDPLDYGDSCWIECQLRGRNDDQLLAITGWQLEKIDGIYYVDDIAWQDFRDEFRPGIGRQEWMRVCG